MQELDKAMEILDKLSFFGGQRAGRELWNDKPREVQDEDIASFNRDIKWLRDFIRNYMNDGWIPVEERLPAAAESKKRKRQRMTNIDRVRQMDDDELADFIIKGCIGEKRACCSHDETVEWLRWEDSISNGEG